MKAVKHTAVGFGIYVHYPLCLRRCGYCDFAIVPKTRLKEAFPERAYTSVVLSELEARAADYAAAGPLFSVYFGGGTPSLWDAEMIGDVVALACRLFGASPEVTVEANPEDLSAARLMALQRAGMTRLSLGVQSLDNETLKQLSRVHTAEQVAEVVSTARQVGIQNLSCDLIFGIEGQTLDSHRIEVERLLALRPDHISAYSLSLTPSAPLRGFGVKPARSDLVAEMLEEGRELLEQAGYLQYEVSSYAPVDRRSQHNTLVWRGRPYLGVGASAHSLSVAADGTAYRIANPIFERYLRGGGVVQDSPRRCLGARVERLQEKDALLEQFMVGFRTVDGIDRSVFRMKFGHDPLERHGLPLRKLAAQGMVNIEKQRIVPTRQGIWFADELALRVYDC